jgi:hypothetical protein
MVIHTTFTSLTVKGGKTVIQLELDQNDLDAIPELSTLVDHYVITDISTAQSSLEFENVS